jgi:hypothetical protein
MAETIKYESQLPGLISTLLGSKTTTTGNANVDPLEQVFKAAMTAQGAGVPEMQQLISSIFQEGAKQVPSLIAAYSNATGTRSTNNSGLALALNDLNKNMSVDAAKLITENQTQNRTIATNAGTGIANATRGTTQVQKTAVNPLLPMVAGFGLNQFGKSKTGKKFMDELFDGKDSSGGSAVNLGTVTGPDASLASNFDSVSQLGSPVNEVASTLGGVTGDWGPSVDYGSDVANGAVQALDTSNAVDLGSVTGDAADLASDFGDGGGFDLGDLFDWRDGGQIAAHGRHMANGGIVNPSENVADDVGGTILGVPSSKRRKNGNIGSDNPAMSFGGIGLGIGTGGGNISTPIGSVNDSGPPTTISGSGDVPTGGGGGGGSEGGGVTPTPSGGGGTIDWTQAIGPIASVVAGPIAGFIVTQVIKQLNKTPTATVTPGTLETKNRGGSGVTSGGGVGGSSGDPADPTGSVTAGNVTAGAGAGDAELGDQQGNISTVGDTAGNFGSGDSGVNENVSFDDRMGANEPGGTGENLGSGGGGGGDSSSGGSDGYGGDIFDPAPSVSGGAMVTASGSAAEHPLADGGLASAMDDEMKRSRKAKPASYADGGRISGPGTGTSDSIPIAASDGEYVMPADVVRFWGTRHLDMLKNAAHTPANTQ